jgi:uncharacterized membrane protein YfcA
MEEAASHADVGIVARGAGLSLRRGPFGRVVDSIAGGGGLISLPVLLSVGLPPQLALGTNKLQGSFGTFSSAFNYIRKGKADLNRSYAGILFTLIGAMLGAWVIQQLEADFLKPLIPILLAMVFFVYAV